MSHAIDPVLYQALHAVHCPHCKKQLVSKDELLSNLVDPGADGDQTEVECVHCKTTVTLTQHVKVSFDAVISGVCTNCNGVGSTTISKEGKFPCKGCGRFNT